MMCASSSPVSRTGDAGDVTGEVPIDLDRELAARDALERELVAQALGERARLGLPDLARHRDQVVQIGPELVAEGDLPDAPAVVPVSERAREIHAERRALQDPTERGGAEQHPRDQRRRHDEIERSHRPVRRPVRDPDVVPHLPRPRHARSFQFSPVSSVPSHADTVIPSGSARQPSERGAPARDKSQYIQATLVWHGRCSHSGSKHRPRAAALPPERSEP